MCANRYSAAVADQDFGEAPLAEVRLDSIWLPAPSCERHQQPRLATPGRSSAHPGRERLYHLQLASARAAEPNQTGPHRNAHWAPSHLNACIDPPLAWPYIPNYCGHHCDANKTPWGHQAISSVIFETFMSRGSFWYQTCPDSGHFTTKSQSYMLQTSQSNSGLEALRPGGKMRFWSALSLLMPWCYSARPSTSTKLTNYISMG